MTAVGYKRKKTVLLKWDDDQGEMAGFEVRAKRISVRKFLKLAPLMESDLDTFTPDDVKAMEKLFLEFGRVLDSWNLEDEDTGEPVPCTPESFLEQDIELVKEIITGWAENVAGVAAPLDGTSPSGEPSPEASIPMEPLSSSLAS